MVQEFLTMNEVTAMLRVSDDTIAKEIKAGRLQAFKIGRGWRFTEEDLNEYIESRKTQKKKK